MNSSRIAVILAALGIALLLYSRFMADSSHSYRAPPEAPRHETPSEDPQAARPTPPREPSPAAMTFENQTAETIPAPAAEPPQTSAPRKAPPHALSFQREGQLIVVFGDVLYGKLKDDDGSPTGFVHARPVELWESGAIPYHIDPELKNPERVQKTLQLFSEKTPIRFVPFNGQANAIVFAPGEKNCRSYLGKIGGHQPIYLDDKCGVPEIAHELMHALGFIHEQSRPDRDRFVKINWDRIDPEHAAQFEIAPEEVARLSLSRPFDYKSTMLYDSTMFAKTAGQITLESITAEPIEPAAEGLSREDIERIYKFYGQ